MPASDIHPIPSVPPPQDNLNDAVQKAIEQLQGQNAEQLRWLGAEPAGEGRWRLRVLGQPLAVDLRDGAVTTADGRDVRLPWRILVLHYLAVRERPELGPPSVTFAHLPDGRVYASNYEGRVIRRMCATVGRDERTLRGAATALSARFGAGGTMAFDLQVLPHLTMRVIWETGDEEFSPSACILLPGGICEMFCIEDVVVLSEQVVSRLSGRGL